MIYYVDYMIIQKLQQLNLICMCIIANIYTQYQFLHIKQLLNWCLLT